MTKFIVEILQEVNENPEAILQYKDNVALRMCFYYGFDTRLKFQLPEGEPPFKRDAAPIGMSPTNLQMETRTFYIYNRSDLTALRRESKFLQLLEGLHPSEADLMLAIKDQDIARLYPNVTYETICKIINDIPQEFAAVAKPKSEEKPRGKGRPPGAKNKPKDDEPVEEVGTVTEYPQDMPDLDDLLKINQGTNARI